MAKNPFERIKFSALKNSEGVEKNESIKSPARVRV